MIELRERIPWVVAIIAVGLCVGCGSSGTSASDSGVDPEQRAVRLETTGCGPASGRTGSGVVLGPDLMVTVAHLIARAETVTVFIDGYEPREVEVAAIDLERDIAILRGSPTTFPDVGTSRVSAGDGGHIVGGARSGTVPFEVKRYIDLTIEEILGTERHNRLGYEVRARTADGDSGAGAYDENDDLIGIVFATGPEEDTTWLTAISEVSDFVAGVGPTDRYELCS